MLYCDALAHIADGADYRPHLRRARDRAEAEGRRADVDCVLALSYAAACRDDAEQAAELVGASGGGLFHDTANFVHHMLIRDRVVRPMLDAAAFEAALERGRARPVTTILAEQGLCGRRRAPVHAKAVPAASPVCRTDLGGRQTFPPAGSRAYK
jgi:hypothetical protein